MRTLTSILPITVLSAVLLFIIKELVEGFRRWNGNQRKKKGIRTLLAVECERNHYSITALRKILEDVKHGPEKIWLEKTSEGIRLIGLVVTKEYGTTGGTSLIPRAHRTYADRYMLEVALLDKKLFASLLSAYDALLELDHVSSTLIRTAETVISGTLINPSEEEFFEPEQFGVEGYIETFAEWGLEELESIYETIGNLHHVCTGKALTEKRYR